MSYSINKLNQFMNSPAKSHWLAAKWLLLYLKGMPRLDSHTRATSSLDLAAYCNADWASYPGNQYSTGCFLVFISDTLVSWSSKKQIVVARSSTESQYHCLANTVAELVWLHSLLTKLQLPCSTPFVIWCDNTSAVAVAFDPIFHACAKHIEVDAHFIHEQVLAESLVVFYVPIDDQLPDCLMKPLSISRFLALHAKLGLAMPPLRLRGDVMDQKSSAQQDLKIDGQI